jgi:hypothetical protein
MNEPKKKPVRGLEETPEQRAASEAAYATWLRAESAGSELVTPNAGADTTGDLDDE